MKSKKKQIGILFFMTGLSGAGKTSLAKAILPFIEKKYGKTIILSSEKLRSIFKLKGYDLKSREQVGLRNVLIIEHIVNQNVNIIYDAIALRKKLRKIKRKKIKNYVEIFIDAKMGQIIKFRKKRAIYEKLNSNIVGLHLKPEFPKKFDIRIKNDFKKSIHELSLQLEKKIEKKIKLFS